MPFLPAPRAARSDILPAAPRKRLAWLERPLNMQTGRVRPTALPTKRGLGAALRSAAMYANGVVALLLALMLLTGVPDVKQEDIEYLRSAAAIAFLVMFLFLGFARRTGLMAMLVLLLLLWCWQVFLVHTGEADPAGVDFVFWSILAAPILSMVARAFPRPPLPSGEAWANRLRMLVWLGCWGALAFVGVKLEHRPRWLALVTWSALKGVWMVAPPVATIRALIRVYRVVPATAHEPNDSPASVGDAR